MIYVKNAPAWERIVRRLAAAAPDEQAPTRTGFFLTLGLPRAARQTC